MQWGGDTDVLSKIKKIQLAFSDYYKMFSKLSITIAHRAYSWPNKNHDFWAIEL